MLTVRRSFIGCMVGDLYYDRGRQEEAISYWQRSIASDPNHVSSLRNLGWAWVCPGQADKGRENLREALRIDHSHLFSRHLQLWLEDGFFGPLAYGRGSDQGDLN
ncbi:MAG: tetratricopeptide repeat protein [Acidobacteriota bacterium]